MSRRTPARPKGARDASCVITGGEEDGPDRNGRADLFAVIAVVVLIALGYLAFNWIDQRRKVQNCIDSGRHGCLPLDNSAR